MKFFLNMDNLKVNNVIDLRTLDKNLIVPKEFEKKLNTIEKSRLLQAQLLEQGLAMDDVVQAGGCRIVEASEKQKKDFRLADPNYASNRLLEFLEKFYQEFGWVVPIEELEGLGFEEGEKILLAAGYRRRDLAKSESTIADYLTDIYFILYNEDDEELDKKSFVQHWNINDDPLNDDGTNDFLVKEFWSQV